MPLLLDLGLVVWAPRRKRIEKEKREKEEKGEEVRVLGERKRIDDNAV